MKTLPTCCECYGVDCVQGRRCPNYTAASFAAECEGVMAMATGCSTKALPDPEKKPLPKVDRARDRTELTLLWLAVALVCTAAVVAGFLTKG